MTKFLPTAILVVLAFVLGMGVVHAAKGEACEVVENYLHTQIPQMPQNIDAKTADLTEPNDSNHGRIQN